MIVIMLRGGLGNQMFQYAFGKYLSIKYNTPLYINTILLEGSDRNFALEIFQITKYNYGDGSNIGIQVTLDDITHINELQFNFDSEIIKQLDSISVMNEKVIVIKGYWQSYKYFSNINDVILSEFTLKKKLIGKWDELHKKLILLNSVMIHIRRADYLSKLEYHGVVSEEYLKSAIQYCRHALDFPRFFVFSDDIPWCIDKLSHIADLEFVDETYYDDKEQFYFKMMMSCKHYILSNSSFGWWATWLGHTTNSVIIRPKQWFTAKHINSKDMIPKNWISIKNTNDLVAFI